MKGIYTPSRPSNATCSLPESSQDWRERLRRLVRHQVLCRLQHRVLSRMRALGEKLGMSAPTDGELEEALIRAKMLRAVQVGIQNAEGRPAIAGERMSVTVGATTLVLIVIDYVPERLRKMIPSDQRVQDR